MPPQQKKTAPRKAPAAKAAVQPVNPAEAAAAEAQDKPIAFKFRGQDFTAPRDMIIDARFVLANASGHLADMVLAVLGGDGNAYRRLMGTLKPGDNFVDVTTEFLDALSAAAGWGNS